jgi:predicted dehydrogenase
VLAAGRHVLVEKPLARTLDDCDRIIRAAASSGLTVAVGLNYRSHSLIRETERILATGALGRLVLIATSMTNAVLRRPDLPAWVHEDGPSAMFEKGVHHFDLWRFLGGSEVAMVRALGATDTDPKDATVGVLARLESGTVCVTGLSGEAGFGQHITLCGTAERLDVNLEPPRPLEPANAAGPRGAAAAPQAGLTGLIEGSYSTALTAGPEDRIASYTAEWEDFAAAVREGRSPAATVEDGRAAVRIALAVNRSLFEDPPVALSP